MERYPDVYEHVMAVHILPTRLISATRHKDIWFKNRKNKYIEIFAWDDTDPDVCKGEILIKAALGGDPRSLLKYFSVPKYIYETQRHEYGLVCSADLHEEVEPY